MSVDSRFEGGFSGTRRQGKIHYRLFSLLTGYDGHFRHRNGFVEENTEDALVFSWLTDVNGWDDVDEGVFISLARALPQANFRYYTFMKEEVGGGDESINDIEFENGSLRFRSELVYADEIMYSFECPHCGCRLLVGEEEAFGETYDCSECGETIDLSDVIPEEEDIIPEEDDFSDEDHDYESMQIDNEGNIVGDEEYLQECIESEKESLAELLALTITGTDDSARLLDLGMLYETGLAGVEKDLNKAWDCYLKAAAAGDQAAIEFVTEIFSAENRMELRELLTNKCISAESYSVFFDLGSAYNDAELTAELLDYKKALEEQ